MLWAAFNHPMYNLGIYLAGFLWYAVIIVVPGGAFSLVLHFLLSLPMRRRDRALFFLDLLETVVDRGRPVEPAIISAAENHDCSIGIQFFLVAAQVEDGLRLGPALERVPGFLPPQVNAMLQAGERLGDYKKVLPACREVLRIAPDTVRTTMHYMVAILMLFAPASILIILFLSHNLIPRFKDVAGGMGIALWPISIFDFVLTDSGALVALETTVFVLLLGVTIFYVGGPGLLRWFRFRRLPLVDWITWHVPWKRKKLLRTFSAMLAVLLDSGVPEPEAVRMAGEATANEICRRRAERVVHELQGGVKLEEAVRSFDETGEFHWRLTNAAQARGGFLPALRGWHAALDAKAFQQEETATHALTSGLVILNGVIVGLIATGMFAVLIAALHHALDE